MEASSHFELAPHFRRRHHLFFFFSQAFQVEFWPRGLSRYSCPGRSGHRDNIGGIDTAGRTSFGPIDVVSPRGLYGEGGWPFSALLQTRTVGLSL